MGLQQSENSPKLPAKAPLLPLPDAQIPAITQPVGREAEAEKAEIEEAWEKYAEQGQAKADQIDELYNPHISPIQHSEVTGNEANRIRNGQKDDVALVFNGKSEEIERLSRTSNFSLNQMKAMIQSAYERANLQADLIINTNKRILAMMGLVEASQKFTPEQIIQLKKLLVNINKISHEPDPRNDSIMSKLAPNENVVNRELTSADYQYIIAQINPCDLQRVAQLEVTAEQVFETATVGLFLHFMSPKQNLDLLREMAKTPGRQAQIPDLVNAMLLVGYLEPRQAERLVQEGIITMEQYESAKIRERIENGSYVKAAEAIMKKIQEDAKTMQNSEFIHSTAENIFGSQGFGMALATHASVWMLLQALMAGFGFSEMSNNPLMGIAAGEFAYGLEVATATKGASGVFGDSKVASFLGLAHVGSGIIGQTVRRFHEALSDEGEILNDTERNAYKLFGKIYMQDTALGNFFKADGVNIIAKLHQARVQEHAKDPKAPLSFTYKDLFDCATPEQRIFLDRAVRQSTTEKVESSANTFSDVALTLDIKNQKQLDYYVRQIEKDYGINQ